MQDVTRRLLLSHLAAPAMTALVYPMRIEPLWLELTRTPVRFFPEPLSEPLRLLHLADLHASWVVPPAFIDEALDLAISTKPDLVCVTGDFVTGSTGFDPDRLRSQLERLSRVAPTFGVLGNHDGGHWARESVRGGFDSSDNVLRLTNDAGLQMLHNQACQFEFRGKKMNLAGVGDLWADEMDGEAAFRGFNAEPPTMLLAHNPDCKDHLSRHRWDLMLSGHTHGGQVVLPGLGTRLAPVEDQRYVAGLKPWGRRQVFVTRGVGSALGVRFRCRPEVSLLLVS